MEEIFYSLGEEATFESFGVESAMDSLLGVLMLPLCYSMKDCDFPSTLLILIRGVSLLPRLEPLELSSYFYLNSIFFIDPLPLGLARPVDKPALGIFFKLGLVMTPLALPPLERVSPLRSFGFILVSSLAISIGPKY